MKLEKKIYELNNILDKIKFDFYKKKISNYEEFKIFKSKYIGKNGYLYKYMSSNISDLSENDKSEVGKIFNLVKKNINIFFNEKKILIKNKKLYKENIDFLFPSIKNKIGNLHPINIVINDIKFYFKNLGYNIYIGNEIEDYLHNFDYLNIPKDHPSRNKSDTFWINNFKLLRTHTSSIQIRYSYINNKIPINILSYGKVYRKDKDKTHSPMFHQIEGFSIDKNINLINMKTILTNFINYFFKKKMKIRYRISYFPFTEPSIEIDIFFNRKWVEILGCGIIHTNVLDKMKINSNKYSGFAFGMGVERLLMIKYKINNLKTLFENDLNFLSQFSFI
ncbi:phenylalanine--tRNA ligase alpha subunit [endosymbiont of Sipalinus gigas]|uniref:phenylalanine--tRNA ligase subunit alpha n=1 Tax=endosymbiont of Sipalinus gigas TaxID=1972134 RepID=UPI000DC701CB|nr:phenylalanine--tRNA ligase subunit alpha [endosymbiont of Sipalinus gigas]BBA85232.1 phenylalanine--tRNA ligase alpha subunit [endosymbiont of Sipalinus gigas]